MTTDFYSHGGYPATGAAGTSAAMRSELDLVEAGFAKLAALTGNGSKFLRVNSGATAYEAIDVPSVVTALFSAVISPTQITSNQNDYNPTSLSTATAVRISTDASRDITGLQGGTAGRLLLVANAGSFNAVLKAEDAGSSAANRFALTYDLTLLPGWMALLWYDGTSSRWRAEGLQASAFIQTLLDDADAATARTTLELNSPMATGSIIDAKGDIIVGTANNTPARKAVGSNGQIIVADSTQTDGLIWTDFSRDPLNVNPNILIDQINEGALYTVSSAGTTQGPDGWSGVVSVSGGVFKMRQVADPDNAAKKCLEITCTTADAAVGATDLAYLFTDIEGYDISSLSPGTASAGSIVTMLETRSLPAGVYGIRVTNSAGNRAYVSTFTTSGAAAWQQHYLTWTLDTTGTWLYTNGTGVRVQICLMAGANYQGSTGSWGATTNFSTASQVNFLSSTSNIGYLRMHVIPGNVVCAYKPADIQRELEKAQRYWWKTYSQGVAVGTATALGAYFVGNFQASTSVQAAIRYPVPMRAAPTFAGWSYNTGNQGYWVDNAGTDQGVTFDNIGATGCRGYIGTGSLFQAGGQCAANARLS